ncbi:adhesion G protein-coupled receptor L4-like isoform X2 [Dendronephthya gigantea]|uniref:adhesion G protein-coupled receptor L4-like isoform X2 n=1 Tax=Dendronephthya gigantea TaxID=151771 RepID=UPI00106C6FD9|nr:adhesion G protein-coupled receptor L4-like isoform X2 [Dendronephthya gigantea]
MIISNIIVALCLLTVINVKPIKSSNSTKCHRLCVCPNLTIVDCSNKSLTSVPDDLPVSVKILLLKHNGIKSLSPNSFLGLRNLTEVDLSGNKLDCNCSLSWLKNASSSRIKFKAICESPPQISGRSFKDISMDDMCSTPSSTQVAITPGRSTSQTNTTPHPTTMPALSTAKESVTSSKIRTTTANTSMTRSTPQTTIIETQTTTVKPQTTTVEVQTTTVKVQTTTVEGQTTTVKPKTATAEPQTTTHDAPTTVERTETKITMPQPTHQPNVSSSPAPTGRQNLTDSGNLTSIVERSNRKDLNAVLLRDVIKKLESVVEGQNHSDSKTTKDILLVSSNLMRKENRKIWSTANKNFPAGESLLKIVNKAMRLFALGMLKSTTNNSQHFSVNHTNLEAEIYVDVGQKLSEKEIQFPSTKSTKNDYVTFSKSSFKTAGKNKVSVIGMKSAELGDLLPQRSLIDDFDSFKTGSGVLSASVLSLEGKISSSVKISFNNKGFLGKDEELTKCVFWKHENTGKDGNEEVSSGWSDEGCRLSSRNRSTTICHCDHMTDFAVLTQSIQFKVVTKPTVIMYVAGLCLLFGALIAMMRNIFVWCKTRNERLSVLVHECLAFILAAVVFLLGLFLEHHQVMCMIFAALLHWFILAVFCWILAEFLQLYMCSHFGWNRSSSRLKYFSVIGWVFPLVLVAITLAITRKNEYGSTQWCWYSNSEIILLTYVVPIVLCILFSIMVILKITCFKSDATDEGEKRDLSIVMALSAFLIPLVLCAFTMAALSAEEPEEDVFQYLFAMFCILVAIYIVVYHCWLDREVMKLSVRKNVERPRPKRDYYSTKETVMYSEGTSEGKSFSLIFPSRKSPEKKPAKTDRKSAKRSDSSSPFDYDSTVPMYPGINDSSLKSFKSQVSTQQHTLDTPPNTLTAITISRPNSQCIELTSLSDLDRRPDGAEQTDAGETGEFYGSRHSNPLDRERQRTSGCSTDCTNNSTTFGKEKVVPKPSEAPGDNEGKNRISGASSVGLSRTSRSSVSGASQTAPGEENLNDDGFEDQPFIRRESELGPEIRSDPPAKIPKRRKRGSRRRLDEEFHDDETDELKPKVTRQSSSTLPSEENSSVKLKHYTSF